MTERAIFHYLPLLILSVFSLHSAWSSDWPQFRGPGGQGHANAAADVPLQWNAEKDIAWKVEIIGKGWSSPVIADGKVFVTTAKTGTGAALSLHAVARKLEDGKPAWEQRILTKDSLGPFHEKNSHASPTPIYEKGKLYTHFGHYGTACLDATDGTVLWTQETLGYDPRHGNGGSPILVDDKLIFSCDGQKDPFIVALNKATGEVIWKTSRSISTSIAFSTPLAIEAGDRRQVVSAAGRAVFAYDPETGDELWHCRFSGGKSVVPKPLYAHGLIYVCTGFNTASLYAIDPTGTGDITDTHVRWTQGKRIPKESTPIIVGDHLYANDDKGIVSCFDAKSGTPLWQERIDGSGTYSASPVYVSGHLFFHNAEGVTTVIKPAATFQRVAESTLGLHGLSSFAVTTDGFVIRTESDLLRIRASER